MGVPCYRTSEGLWLIPGHVFMVDFTHDGVNGARGESADCLQIAVFGRQLRVTGWLCMTGWYPGAPSQGASYGATGHVCFARGRDRGPCARAQEISGNLGRSRESEIDRRGSRM